MKDKNFILFIIVMFLILILWNFMFIRVSSIHKYEYDVNNDGLINEYDLDSLIQELERRGVIN